MDNGKIVWGPHPEKGFILGTIVDIGQNTITVQPKDTGAKVILSIILIDYYITFLSSCIENNRCVIS